MAGKAKTVKKTVVTKNTDKDIVFEGAIKTKAKIVNDPKNKQIIVENPPPPKTKPNNTETGFPRDIEFLGKALVTQTNRINELELCIEDMDQKLKRVMGRMGL